VTLLYHPDTHQLTVETRLAELVTAEAQGAAEASGVTAGEVAVEAVGKYYEDGWGGRTEERALEEAQAEAEEKLAQAVDALHREQNREVIEAAEAEARAEAEVRARETLAEKQAEVRAALRGQLQATLARAEERVYHTVNRAVGEAYRQTLRQLVLESGGRVLMDEQTGSVINMELELY
jgi:Skp family chaperone for outer membrane proteins